MLEHAWTWLSCSGHDTYVLNKMFHVPNMAEHDNHVQNMTVVFCHVLEHDCHVLKQDSNIPEHDKTWLSCSGPCLSCCKHDGYVLYKMFHVHNMTEHDCHVPEHAWTWLSCSDHAFRVVNMMVVFYTRCFMFTTSQNMKVMFRTWLPCSVMFQNITDVFQNITQTCLNMPEHDCHVQGITFMFRTWCLCS